MVLPKHPVLSYLPILTLSTSYYRYRQAILRYFKPLQSLQIEFGYRSVWLKAWRHWTDLGPDCPKKEDDQPTPRPQKADKKKWFELAALAVKHGFESDQLSHLTSLNPDREIAREVLNTARDPTYFRYDNSALEDYLNRMPVMFDQIAIPKSPSLVNPPLLVNGPGEGLERRCGRVFERAYRDDREHLFIDKFSHPRVGEGTAVSSLFVRASVYFAFFGESFKSGMLPVLGDKSRPLNEGEAVASTEVTRNASYRPQQATFTTGVRTPQQIPSAMVREGPSDAIVVDNEGDQELASSTQMALALSKGGEMEVRYLSFIFNALVNL